MGDLLAHATRKAPTEPLRTVIDQSQLQQVQLKQLITTLKQQMLKRIREKSKPKEHKFASRT